MSGPVFHGPTSGRNVIAGAQASHGGVINMNFAEPATQPRKPCSTVPFPPDKDFVNRPDFTTWLRAQLVTPGARVALVGLGGFGYV